MSVRPHSRHRNCTRVTISARFDYADGSSITLSEVAASGCWPGGWRRPNEVVRGIGPRLVKRADRLVRSWV
jgi:hypothetical protein